MKKKTIIFVSIFLIINIALVIINNNKNIMNSSIDKKILTKKKDTKAPVIKLKGGKTITMYLGAKWVEPGYSVSDNSGEKLVKKVKIKSNLNTNKFGTYKITYSVSDSSGNKTSITRTVKVVYSNVIKNLTWISNGIRIRGLLYNAAGNIAIKICDSNNKCDYYRGTPKGRNYDISLDLSKYNNGNYTIKLRYKKNEYNLIDNLNFENKIVRKRIGNKLVTMKYNKSTPYFTIEDFKYQYDVLIDVGHGGFDSGAKNKYILEKYLNLTQSLYEKKRYEDHGLKVLITRTDDTYGMMMGSSDMPRLRRKAYAIGYYGGVSKIVYGNHHNSTQNTKVSGYELILTNQGTKNRYQTEYKIASEWKKIYPNLDKHTRIYGRNYDTDAILKKEDGQVYSIKNYYAVQRIPFELFGVYTTTYEGCYLSNLNDFNWYIKNWKKLSEIKIKNYVESLGIEYKEA